jgi:hypothetical protein
MSLGPYRISERSRRTSDRIERTRASLNGQGLPDKV